MDARTASVGTESAVTPEPSTSPYLTTQAAAEYLSLSPRTLEKHRVTGTGPHFRKHGGKVVYRRQDLDDWSARGDRVSTSDPGPVDAPKPYRHGLPQATEGGTKKRSGGRS